MKLELDYLKLNIGEKLRKIREQKGLNQEDMAFGLKMSVSGYSRIERNEVKLSLDKMITLCNILNVSIEKFLIDKRELPKPRNYKINNQESLQDMLKAFEKVEAVYQQQIAELKTEIEFLRKLLRKQRK